MTPEDKIKILIRKLAEEKAYNLHSFRRLFEGETRDWDELPEEEKEARFWYGEYLIKFEMPEMFE